MSKLEQIATDVWIAEGGVVSFHGFPYPTRSVVARLRDGALWVWSPVALSSGLRDEIDRLGTPAHLVSPNKLHHLFLAQWRSAYPRVKLWGPRSAIRRRPDLAFAEPLADCPPDAWGGAFDQVWFRGSFALDEIVFFHVESGVVIIADLIQAFDKAFLCDHWAWWQRPLAAIGGISAEAPGAPGDLRLSFLDRSAARRAREKILNWRCGQVVIAHGQGVAENGSAFLRRGFAWLGG